ncbi:hypothetical protein [Microbacterium aquimaris]|uniref:Uncharacterized protein n=1 Tax=Microbacterium aquimaris TaxID=459816 RepID=A0ABU5N434_9MICO|nr:hypothetical protein [Microbacterium aquimaris]MDZ8160813.1 hypothetical protein [Microbacterium aquimaris]
MNELLFHDADLAATEGGFRRIYVTEPEVRLTCAPAEVETAYYADQESGQAAQGSR